jgi:hypothetical protein
MPQQDQPQSGGRSSRRFGGLATALAAGIVGGLIAPLLYPVVARNARPVSRRVLKAGIAAFERGRELAAEFGERASDLMAEARAEYDAEHKPLSEEQPAAAKEVVRLRGAGRETTGD